MTEQNTNRRADSSAEESPGDLAASALPGAGEPEIRERIIDALKTCYDPEIPVNIYELGLIYEVTTSEDRPEPRATSTPPAAPAAPVPGMDQGLPPGAVPGAASTTASPTRDETESASEETPLEGLFATVIMTLTSPMCPVAGTLPVEVEQKVRSVEGIGDARVELVWEPQWTPEMMSDAAKLQLNMF